MVMKLRILPCAKKLESCSFVYRNVRSGLVIIFEE